VNRAGSLKEWTTEVKVYQRFDSWKRGFWDEERRKETGEVGGRGI
jgi:hypothetical protein